MADERKGFELDLSQPLFAASGKPAKITESDGEAPRDATVRDYFLLLLSAQAGMSAKESLILKDLTFELANEDVSSVELNVKRLELLRKITKDCKSQRGEPLLNALAQAQLLEALGLSEDDL